MKKNIIMIIILCFVITGCDGFSHAHKEYYCENGTLEDDHCNIYETSEIILQCDEGEELEENQCKYVSLSLPATTGEKACSKGYYPYINSMCVSDDTTDYITTIECPDPENDNETITAGLRTCFRTTCKKKDDKGKCIESVQDEVEGKLKKVCPSGYKNIDLGCRKYYYSSGGYRCPSGELVEKNCVYYDYKDATKVCEEGFSLNEEKNICEKSYSVDATVQESE